MKKQIWLRPDQCELLVDCLKFTQSRLNEGTALSEAHKMAGRFVYRRITELLSQVEPVPHNVELRGDQQAAKPAVGRPA